MTNGYILLTVAIIFNGVANVLMKKGMVGYEGADGPVGMIKHYLTSWPVMVGLILFALNVVAYTQALAKIPLSIAYPVMVSLTGLIVISSSLFFFKESISWIQWLGFVLIIGGVFLVAK